MIEIGQRWQRIPDFGLIIEVFSDVREDSCTGKVLYSGKSTLKVGAEPHCSSFKDKYFWKLLANQNKPL
jgi:hypothetical protein